VVGIENYAHTYGSIWRFDQLYVKAVKLIQKR